VKTVERQISNAQFLPQVISLLNEGHTATIHLRGISMRPFLEDNRDRAILTKAGKPTVGAPVLAEIEPGHFVLHRIIAISGDSVTLRGDGNIMTEHCSIADVKAEAIGFYRKGRKRADMTSGMKWRIYSLLWTRLTPLTLRRYILAAYRRIKPLQQDNPKKQ
jgi:hypothetical protein